MKTSESGPLTGPWGSPTRTVSSLECFNVLPSLWHHGIHLTLLRRTMFPAGEGSQTLKETLDHNHYEPQSRTERTLPLDPFRMLIDHIFPHACTATHLLQWSCKICLTFNFITNNLSTLSLDFAKDWNSAQSHPVEVKYSQTNVLIFAPFSSKKGPTLDINVLSSHPETQGTFWQQVEMHKSLL